MTIFCLLYEPETVMPLCRAVFCLLCTLFLVPYQKMLTNYSSREAETGMKVACRYMQTWC